MMDNNNFDLFHWIWTALMVPLGYILTAIRALGKKTDHAHKRISEHELVVAEKYIRADQFDKTIERLFNKLDRIESKLDTKVDK